MEWHQNSAAGDIACRTLGANVAARTSCRSNKIRTQSSFCHAGITDASARKAPTASVTAKIFCAYSRVFQLNMVPSNPWSSWGHVRFAPNSNRKSGHLCGPGIKTFQDDCERGAAHPFCPLNRNICRMSVATNPMITVMMLRCSDASMTRPSVPCDPPSVPPNPTLSHHATHDGAHPRKFLVPIRIPIVTPVTCGQSMP